MKRSRRIDASVEEDSPIESSQEEAESDGQVSVLKSTLHFVNTTAEAIQAKARSQNSQKKAEIATLYKELRSAVAKGIGLLINCVQMNDVKVLTLSLAARMLRELRRAEKESTGWTAVSTTLPNTQLSLSRTLFKEQLTLMLCKLACENVDVQKSERIQRLFDLFKLASFHDEEVRKELTAILVDASSCRKFSGKERARVLEVFCAIFADGKFSTHKELVVTLCKAARSDPCPDARSAAIVKLGSLLCVEQPQQSSLSVDCHHLAAESLCQASQTDPSYRVRCDALIMIGKLPSSVLSNHLKLHQCHLRVFDKSYQVSEQAMKLLNEFSAETLLQHITWKKFDDILTFHFSRNYPHKSASSDGYTLAVSLLHKLLMTEPDDIPHVFELLGVCDKFLVYEKVLEKVLNSS